MAKILVNERFIAKIVTTYGDNPESIANTLAKETANGWSNTAMSYQAHGSIGSKTVLAFQKRLPQIEKNAFENVDDLSNEALLRAIYIEEADFYHEFFSKDAVINFSTGISLRVADRFLQFKHITVVVGNRVIAIAEEEKNISNVIFLQKKRVIWQGIKKEIFFAVVNLKVTWKK